MTEQITKLCTTRRDEIGAAYHFQTAVPKREEYTLKGKKRVIRMK